MPRPSLGSAMKGAQGPPRLSLPLLMATNAAEAVCACDACRGRLTTIRLETRGGRASPSSIATTALSPAVHGPVRIVVVINDEGVEQAFGLRNFRISGLSPTDGYATEDDLSAAILSALSRPLPAPAINAFLRLPSRRAPSSSKAAASTRTWPWTSSASSVSRTCCRPSARRARAALRPQSFEDDCARC